MASRSTPARLEEARRAATRNRLIGDGLPEDRADALIAAWDSEAGSRGLPRDLRYWDGAWEWIETRRRKQPWPAEPDLAAEAGSRDPEPGDSDQLRGRPI